MTEWTFRLILRGIELRDEQLDTLYEAGCDDGSFSVESDGAALAQRPMAPSAERSTATRSLTSS